MYTFEQATHKAKQYLSSQGIYFTVLNEVRAEGQKWVITYQDAPIFGNEKYMVELDKETGEILSYRRYK